jgi:chaperonin GroES
MATKKAKLSLKPTAGYLLIEPLDAEVKTASGIYLPDNASEKPQKGKVLAVGPDENAECKCDCGCRKSSPAKAGDIVIYKESWGGKVKIEGKEYLFAKFEDILGIES